MSASAENGSAARRQSVPAAPSARISKQRQPQLRRARGRHLVTAVVVTIAMFQTLSLLVGG